MSLADQPAERAAAGEPPRGPVSPTEDYISISVATLGNVVELERVPLAATIAEVVNSVRTVPASDWSEVALFLHHPGSPSPKTLSPGQSLREAGVKAGDTLMHAYAIKAGSGWQEVAFVLAGWAGAGVVGGAPYDLLKSTVRSAARRWRKRQAPDSAPSLSRDEVLHIAQACLSMDSGIDLRDLRTVEIARDATNSGGPETWIVSFVLPHREINVRVSVPADGPEHTMIFIDRHTVR